MKTTELLDILNEEFAEMNTLLDVKIKKTEKKYPLMITGYRVFLHPSKGYTIAMDIDTLKLIDYSAKEKAL